VSGRGPDAAAPLYLAIAGGEAVGEPIGGWEPVAPRVSKPEARKDAERMIGRVTYLRSRLGKQRVAAAFSEIIKLRNRRLAHFDYADGQSFVTVQIRHIQIV
jgi:hypothetical protein